MQSLHTEISQAKIEMADQAKEVVVRLEGIDEDSSLEELNDRELAKIERRILNYAARVKEEKDRRRGFVSNDKVQAPANSMNKDEKAADQAYSSLAASAQQFISVNDCWQGSTMQLDRFNSRPSEQHLNQTKTMMFNATLSPDDDGVTLRKTRQRSQANSGEFFNPQISPDVATP